jgi:DNA-binding NtrC family response regulator
MSLRSIPGHVWEMFSTHRWPGNVRELRNAVQRLLVAPELSLYVNEAPAAEPAARKHELSPSIEPLRIARRAAADAFERDYLKAVFVRTEGNVTRAAAIAEVSRQMIQKLMRKHELG